METTIANIDISITGRLLKLARLRHEWFEFVSNPSQTVELLRNEHLPADVFTFVGEVPSSGPSTFPYYQETDSVAILRIATFDDWWRDLDFKVRNKIRKAEKTGVNLRSVPLDDALALGVEKIYNESPIRQGKRFWHYGKNAARIKEDLSSFPEQTCFVGAYLNDELIGFMKLFQGDDVLRTVHIIAKLSHRDKPVQDALIAKAVEMCSERNIRHLHYGSWSTGGLGAFKEKHGFEQVNVPRYFVPMNYKGALMLKLQLHQRLRDRMPPRWRQKLVDMRSQWTAFRYGKLKAAR